MSDSAAGLPCLKDSQAVSQPGGTAASWSAAWLQRWALGS